LKAADTILEEKGIGGFTIEAVAVSEAADRKN
jgi:hypothetical protein